MSHARTRRSDIEAHVVGRFDDNIKRYYDENLERTVVKLMTGDCYVSSDPREMMVTILGSCISVCMRDPMAGVAGMNHILLPTGRVTQCQVDSGFANRFGAYAMEELVNGLIKLGAVRSRMETKIFGGGNVINNSAMIGTRNVAFVKEYLSNEKMAICGEHVGGDYPRRIHYFPDTGTVKMRLLKRKEDKQIVEEEKQFQNTLFTHAPSSTTSVELF